MILSGLVGSDARIEILAFLTKKKAYIREIELTLDLPLFAVQCQLKHLLSEGILKKSIVKNRNYFEFNKKYKLYSEVFKLFKETSKLIKPKKINGNFKLFHRFGKNSLEYKRLHARKSK